jgi:hypothetical protein
VPPLNHGHHNFINLANGCTSAPPSSMMRVCGETRIWILRGIIINSPAIAVDDIEAFAVHCARACMHARSAAACVVGSIDRKRTPLPF